MQCDNIVSEWKECRETIGRFDGYLIKIRLFGVSVFTLLFTGITGIKGVLGAMGGGGVGAVDTPESQLKGFLGAMGGGDTGNVVTPEPLSLVALLLFVLTIYILDRYYERMLLVAVLRASRLEAHQLEGFRIGLTTEIQFQKDKIISKKKGRKYSLLEKIRVGRNAVSEYLKVFSRASTMVNIAYGFMLFIIIISYALIKGGGNIDGVITLVKDIILLKDQKDLIFTTSVILAIFTAFISNNLLSEPNKLIADRSDIVTSNVIYSKAEIETAVNQIVQSSIKWVGDVKKLNIVTILSGARPFTELYIKNIKEKLPDLEITLLPVKITATENNERIRKTQILYGSFASNESCQGTLIIDDLIDSGETIEKVKEMVAATGERNIKTCALINKYSINRRKVDFLGLDLALDKEELHKEGIEDYWLFGFGMDISGSYREIDHIGWVEKYKKTEKTFSKRIKQWFVQ